MGNNVLKMKQRMQTENKAALQRKFHALYLHITEKNNKEIAAILGRSEPTIGKYLHTYYENA